MTMTTDDTDKLESTFAQARRAEVPVSDSLMDRIMMDADMVLAEKAPVAARPRQGFGAMLLDVIGGWTSMGGLAAATVAGLWIGVAPPEAVSNLTSGFLGSTIEVPLLESDVFAGLEG